MYAGIFLSLKPVTDQFSFKKLHKDVDVPKNDNGEYMTPEELVKVTYHIYGKMFKQTMATYRGREKHL